MCNHGLLQIKSAEFFYLKKMVDDGDPIDYDKQRHFASEVFNGHYMKKKKKNPRTKNIMYTWMAILPKKF